MTSDLTGKHLLCRDSGAPRLPLFVRLILRLVWAFFQLSANCSSLTLEPTVLCSPHPSLLSPPPPLKKNPNPLPDEAVQGDQPDEQKQNPGKDGKGKKKKNKRDKDSEGKGKRKGKGRGRKGSRRRKHEENQSTAPPIYPSHQSLQPTELPEIQKGLESLIPAEDFDKFFTETPTPEPQSRTEGPEESKVTEEVDEFPWRASEQVVPANRRERTCPPPSLTSSSNVSSCHVQI